MQVFFGERHEHWPSGTGAAVQVDGFESWTLDEDGLIAASIGSFDAEKSCQLAEGVEGSFDQLWEVLLLTWELPQEALSRVGSEF